MLRTFVCTVVALVLACGISDAADKAKKAKKKGKASVGEITKIDTEKGILTVKVKVKKATEDKEFKVTDKTTVTALDGDNKTEIKGKDAKELLSNSAFKVGTRVAVQANDEGTEATSITINPPAKKKTKKKEAK